MGREDCIFNDKNGLCHRRDTAGSLQRRHGFSASGSSWDLRDIGFSRSSQGAPRGPVCGMRTFQAFCGVKGLSRLHHRRSVCSPSGKSLMVSTYWFGRTTFASLSSSVIGHGSRFCFLPCRFTTQMASTRARSGRGFFRSLEQLSCVWASKRCLFIKSLSSQSFWIKRVLVQGQTEGCKCPFAGFCLHDEGLRGWGG